MASLIKDKDTISSDSPVVARLSRLQSEKTLKTQSDPLKVKEKLKNFKGLTVVSKFVQKAKANRKVRMLTDTIFGNIERKTDNLVE